MAIVQVGNYGQGIQLFLVNGSADSRITATMSNWNGKAIRIPRIEVIPCDREDIKGAGIYFLFCNDEDSESVYIGEAENVKERLKQHINDYQSEKETYFWHTAVVFTGGDLNKALIRYLENRAVEITKKCKRCKVLTKNTYKNTVMNEVQVAAMEQYMDNVKILISILGYNILEPVGGSSSNANADDDLLYITSGNVDARGRITSEGFLLLKDSKISDTVSGNFAASKKVEELRKKYLDSGVLVDQTLTEDTIFPSPSAAAIFVLGYSASGPQAWKNEDGVCLRALQ